MHWRAQCRLALHQAEGPLAYQPEHPPDRDYYFQYGWVLPAIFAEGASRRRHHYFGAPSSEPTTDVFSFWQSARVGNVNRVSCLRGGIDGDDITAPIAVYRMCAPQGGPVHVLIVHGSYQFVRDDDQPLIDSGQLMPYRGVHRSPDYRCFAPHSLGEAEHRAWRIFSRVQAHVLSDSTRSFNSAHDRTSRCETMHVRDRSWMTDAIAREHGLDVESDPFGVALWTAAHQSYSLERSVAENKFGPHYVACKTPLGNARITTFFAGEREARIIDPRKVELVEAHGCRAVPVWW